MKPFFKEQHLEPTLKIHSVELTRCAGEVRRPRTYAIGRGTHLRASIIHTDTSYKIKVASLIGFPGGNIGSRLMSPSDLGEMLKPFDRDAEMMIDDLLW